MATLSGNKVKDTYTSLLKLESNGVTSTLKTVEDGAGVDSALKLSTDTVEVNGTLSFTTAPSTDSSEATALLLDASNDIVKRELGTAAFIATPSIFKNISVQGQSDVVADAVDDTLTIVGGTGITVTTDASTDSVTFANDSLAFKSVAVTGSDTIVADDIADTITFTAGSGISLTGDSSTDTITIAATGGGSGASVAFKTITVSGQTDVVADAADDTLTLAAGNGMTITTAAASDTVTFTADVQNAFKTIASTGQTSLVADDAEDTLNINSGSNIGITTTASTDTLVIKYKSNDTYILRPNAEITVGTTAQIPTAASSVDNTATAGSKHINNYSLFSAGSAEPEAVKVNAQLLLKITINAFVSNTASTTDLTIDLKKSDAGGTRSLVNGVTRRIEGSSTRTAICYQTVVYCDTDDEFYYEVKRDSSGGCTLKADHTSMIVETIY